VGAGQRSLVSSLARGWAAGLLSHLWAGHLLAAARASGRSQRRGRGSNALTPLGAPDPCTAALPPGDVVHQHLAAGVLVLWSLPSIAPRRPLGGSPFNAARFARPASLARRHVPPALGLALGGSAAALTAQHAFSMPPLLFLRFDAAAAAALFAHHTAVGSVASAGAAAHFSISLHAGAPAARAVLKHGSLSRPGWLSLWLGFHSLGLFIHNDAASALAGGLHQLHLRPAAARSLQAFCGLRVLAPRLGSGDFSAHHSLALGAHTAALVLLQGALDAAGSSFAPEKAAHGFAFPCDGPGRGGSCDISAWDSAYLAPFWALNTAAWALFYGHWRSTAAAPHFRPGSGSLLRWFRDYLWYYSSALVRGYGSMGAAEGAAPAWAFLLAHLAWAAGFMFLISWRGYWQEVIEILAYAHLLVGPDRSHLNGWVGAASPAALSIVQARLIGLVHFSAGAPGTYFSFLEGGRGQRELILGDRQTGKTSICLDAILNQDSEPVACVFASVGLRASTLLGISFSVLSRAPAFVAFVFASSRDRPSLQYLAPYSAAALAEFFMWAGQISILVALDDLTKHAACYREVALLLRRPPGREAYRRLPGGAG